MKVMKYVGLMFLSGILTVLIALGDAIVRNQLVAGRAGFPLRFSDTSFFGGGETNYLNLVLDVFFWFLILWFIWQYFPKFFKKS